MRPQHPLNTAETFLGEAGRKQNVAWLLERLAPTHTPRLLCHNTQTSVSLFSFSSLYLNIPCKEHSKQLHQRKVDFQKQGVCVCRGEGGTCIYVGGGVYVCCVYVVCVLYIYGVCMYVGCVRCMQCVGGEVCVYVVCGVCLCICVCGLCVYMVCVLCGVCVCGVCVQHVCIFTSINVHGDLQSLVLFLRHHPFQSFKTGPLTDLEFSKKGQTG